MMTEQGTFIINGTERVIVTQLVRSPGAYLMEPKDPTKQVFTANLMPSRGSWLELEIDKKGAVYARIDRKRKLPITTLLRALPREDPSTGFELDTSLERGDPRALRQLDLHRQHPREGPLHARGGGGHRGLQEAAAGRAADARQRAQPAARRSSSIPKRYDLTKVGRYKLNQRLEVDVPEDVRVLTTHDILALVDAGSSTFRTKLGVPEDSKDFAADAIGLPRDPIRKELDEYEHFGNRRLRTVGELIQEAFRVGLYRMERVVRERMTTEDVDTITPQTIINVRPVQAALKEFFGSSQLSQFMDQTNSLAGAHASAPPLGARRRRPDARARADRGARRPPDPLRPHVPDRDAGRPEHRPDRLARLVRDGLRVRVRPDAVPGRQERQGDRRDHLSRRQRGGEVHRSPRRTSRSTRRPASSSTTTCSAGPAAASTSPPQPKDIQYMDVNPAQIVSVATALIPFLEHNDANRALMGSNMQRQAVPLLIAEPPLVGTGLEYRAAVDTGDVVLADRAGTVVDVDAEQIVVETKDGARRLRPRQVHALEPGHADPPEGDRRPRPARRRRVRCSPTAARPPSGELALGKNLLVAFMPFEGYNFEDAIVVSERLVKDELLSSIHIHEYEIDARSTKLGDEEITRDIPNRSEESLQGPRRPRHRPHRRRGRLRRPARRQGHAEGRDRAHRRGEADPRDLQGEGARGPRHVAQGPARRGRQGDRRQDVLARRRRRSAAGCERARPRLRREEAQGRGGRQARRPPRQQGRDREDRPRRGHAVPRGRHAGRRRAEPAWRTEPDEHRPGARDPPRLGGAPRRVRRRRWQRRRPTPVATPVFDGATPEQVDEALVEWTTPEPRLADQRSPSTRAGPRVAGRRARSGCSTAARASRSTRR